MTVDYGSNNNSNSVNNNIPNQAGAPPNSPPVPPLNLQKVVGQQIEAVADGVVESFRKAANDDEYQTLLGMVRGKLASLLKSLYQPCDQELHGFQFWANGGWVKVGPFRLPKWAQFLPVWSFNALRIYIILYRDAKWKDVALGFGIGATVQLIAPPVLEKAKETFKIGNVDPGLMFLVNTITNVYTIVFSSSWAARAIGYQMGGQAHQIYRAYWSTGKA